METERMLHIFGSFTRKRQSQEVGNKRKSSNSPKISHDRSKSTPHTSKKAINVIARPNSVCNSVLVSNTKLKCPLCKQPFVDPKVLPCFHTVCLKCLQELEMNESFNGHDDQSDESTSNSQVDSTSGGSGYISDKNSTSWSSTSNKRIFCPICGAKTDVPIGGVTSYLPNYLLQHRMVLNTLNADSTHLLCDLCTSDTSAISRCMDCAVNFCHLCEEVHLRQKSSADHDILSLAEARKRGITKVRRQIMCEKHPDLELIFFCTTCFQVVCQDCIANFHKCHPYEHVNIAVKSHLTKLKLAAERAKSIAEQSALSANRLHSSSKQIESQCNKVQAEVEKFIENYIHALEEHKKILIDKIKKIRTDKLEEIGKYKTKLHKRVREARDVAFFLEELLCEGTDVEVMRFLKPVVNKIEECCKQKENKIDGTYLHGSLQFLPEETVQYSQISYPLYGVVTTQVVYPSNCILATNDLNNLRVGKLANVVIETKDKNNVKLERGGEKISAEIRYRDGGIPRCLVADVEDCRDGTYTVSFVPSVAGKLFLSISIDGDPIKGSPFPITIRMLKPHHGTFHCCSFCLSGGNKEASCGCGGRMPGGYKGCGHGHAGHPGRRHWSCCGNVLEHSECTYDKTNVQPCHYQITL